MLTIYNLSGRFAELMAGASIRVLLLAAVAALVLLALRRRASAQFQHAVWTIVLIAMMLLPAASVVFRPLHLPFVPKLQAFAVQTAAQPQRVQSSKPIVIDIATQTMTDPRAARASFTPSKIDLVVGMYLLVVLVFLSRFALGLALAQRIVRRATVLRDSEANLALEDVALCQSASYPLPELLESDQVSVPCVLGAERLSILLPLQWQTWDRRKLEAVLAHELTHIRRGDWYVTLLTAVNKSVFWFHPLAWWLEKRLATLSELASDDASLQVEKDPARYASVLLEVSTAVCGTGRYLRVGLPSLPMANAHPVTSRIHRILDNPRASTGMIATRTWVAIAACALPFFAAIGAAQGPDVPRPVTPSSTLMKEWIKVGYSISPDQARQLEQDIARDPNNMDVRGQLLSYYLYNAMQEPLAKHAEWVIQQHPDSDLAGLVNSAVHINENLLARRKALWVEQAAAHKDNPRVLGNAATFLQQTDPPAAERLLKRAIQLEPGNPLWLTGLAGIYTRMIEADGYSQMGVNMLRLWPEANPSYPGQVKAELDRSIDGALLGEVGTMMLFHVRSTFYGSPGQETLVAQSRRSIAEYAEGLIKRAQGLGFAHPRADEALKVMDSLRQANFLVPVRTPRPSSAQASQPQPASGDRLTVAGSVQAAKLTHHQPPIYPPLAMQARIQGIVRLHVIISADGQIAEMKLQSGHPLMAPPAMEAVRNWRYEPTYLNGRPIAVETDVDVEFKLPPSAQTTQPQPASGERLTVAGSVQAAKLTHHQPPVYPPLAMQSRIQGTVRLHVLIGTDGQVAEMKLQSGHPLMAPSAMEAVRTWRYEPTYLNGRPVAVETEVDVDFKLPQ